MCVTRLGRPHNGQPPAPTAALLERACCFGEIIAQEQARAAVCVDFSKSSESSPSALRSRFSRAFAIDARRSDFSAAFRPRADLTASCASSIRLSVALMSWSVDGGAKEAEAFPELLERRIVEERRLRDIATGRRRCRRERSCDGFSWSARIVLLDAHAATLNRKSTSKRWVQFRPSAPLHILKSHTVFQSKRSGTPARWRTDCRGAAHFIGMAVPFWFDVVIEVFIYLNLDKPRFSHSVEVGRQIP